METIEETDEQQTIEPSTSHIRGSVESDVEDQARAATAENEVSNKDNEN